MPDHSSSNAVVVRNAVNRDVSLKKTTTRFQKRSRLNVFSVYLIILVLSGAVSIFVYKTAATVATVNMVLMNEQLPELNYISELRHWINEQERILYVHYATENRNENIPKLKQAMLSITENIRQLERLSFQDENVEALKKINSDIERISREFVVNINSEKTDWNKARDSLSDISALGQKAQPLLNNLIYSIKKQITTSSLNSNRQLSYMSFGVILFSLIALMIAVIVGYFVRKIIQQNNEKRRLALFIEKSPTPIAAIDWNCEVKFSNISWRKNYSNNSVKEGFAEVRKSFLSQIKKNIQKFKVSNNSYEQWQIKSNDKFLEVSAHKLSTLDQFMIYVDDVSERVKAKLELEFLAYHDALTGLSNVKKLEMDIDKLINNSDKNGFYLFVIGVKRLKQVATTYGHAVSDALIQALVLRIQQTMATLESDFSSSKVYRFTGAKFVIILSKPITKKSYANAIHKINRGIKNTRESPLQTLFGKYQLDYQVGCSEFPEHGHNSSTLLKNANAALVVAQNVNAENIVIFDREIGDKEKNSFQLENDLRSLNFDEQLYLTYQPKVDLNNGSLLGVEALVRWNHPKKGLISPVQFIPIAEQSGLIIKLGEWVLENACLQLKSWHDQGLNSLQMAVNVSPSQLLTSGFSVKVSEGIKAHGLEPKFLEIEITEEVLAIEQETCIEVLNKIRKSGISIAVDDFGTGYSSLAYLTQFPLSKLKIDRSFITGIQNNKNNLAIVNAIIALSKSLGIKVIAEGIETDEELAVLKDLHCQQGQGYLFDRPLTAEEFSLKYL